MRVEEPLPVGGSSRSTTRGLARPATAHALAGCSWSWSAASCFLSRQCWRGWRTWPWNPPGHSTAAQERRPLWWTDRRGYRPQAPRGDRGRA